MKRVSFMVFYGFVVSTFIPTCHLKRSFVRSLPELWVERETSREKCSGPTSRIPQRLRLLWILGRGAESEEAALNSMVSLSFFFLD